MIEFACPACGSVLRVKDALGGKRGKCPKCAAVITVPEPQPARGDNPTTGLAAIEQAARSAPAQPAASPPAGATARPPAGIGGGAMCPSCHQPLAERAVICVTCGIRVPSGRPVLMTRGAADDFLLHRAENIIRWLSWISPFGFTPFYSEARGNARPYATWAIAALTVIVSVWFFTVSWGDSPDMRKHKNLMLWAGQAEPSFEQIDLFYEEGYGDGDAFYAKLEEITLKMAPDELSDDDILELTYGQRQTILELTLAGLTEDQQRRAVRRALEELTPEQRCFGEYRTAQLLTHALLHADIFHLLGNLVFLLIFGSRVNAAIGNLATAVVYPVLAIAAAMIYKASAAAGIPVPMLGASGAIMGLAGMYFALFPVHKVHIVAWWRMGLITGFRLFKKFFAVWGFVVVLFYIGLDVLMLWLSVESGTAHWAHVGGFIAGLVAAFALTISRLAYSGADILSLTLGKYAWPLIGSPSSRSGLDLTPQALRKQQ